MKKRNMLMAALSSVLVLALAACGGSGGGNTATGGAAEPASSAAGGAETGKPAADGDKITIAYWTTNRHDQAYMTPLIEEYNNTNEDNIYIDYQVYADNYNQMVDLAFSTGSAPDVFGIPTTSLQESVDKGYLMDLAPYMTDEYKARFGDGAFVEGINSLGDKIYSFPYTASVIRLFYNQDIFDRVGIEEPPKTLDEMVEDARLITEQLSGEGIYGFAANYKSADAVRRTIDPIVMISGGNRSGFDYRTGTYDFSSYKPVLEGFKELFAGGLAFPGCESLDIDPLRTQFAAGKIGMYISLSHAEPGVYQSQFPTDVNWNCAPVPSLDGTLKGKQQLWIGGAYAAVNANTAHPEEAFKVMQFLHSDEVMRGYYEQGLGTVDIPSAVEGAKEPESMVKMPNLKLRENDKNYPVLPNGVVVEGKSYLNVCIEVAFGMTDVDAAIEDLNTRYNEAYDKAVEGGMERIVYPNFDPVSLNVN